MTPLILHAIRAVRTAPLSIFLVHDALCTGLTANAVLARLFQQATPAIPWQSNYWQLSLFQFDGLCEQAAHEAAQADLVVVSLRPSPSMPVGFLPWFRRWLLLAKPCPSLALVSVFSAPPDCSVSVLLREAGRTQQLELFDLYAESRSVFTAPASAVLALPSRTAI